MRIHIECYRRDRIAHGDGWSGTDNKKGNPISEISFLDSGSFARTHKLEFVVQLIVNSYRIDTVLCANNVSIKISTYESPESSLCDP